MEPGGWYSRMNMSYRFVQVDPGHFHAALVQKEMYPNVDSRVHVYAPLGPDLIDYLTRISRFNHRPASPTAWELEVHASAGYLERMASEGAGNIGIFSGRNRGKIDKILAAIEAGFHVLADKPWVIRGEDLPLLQQALDLADRKGLIAFDIMTERYEIASILQREFANSPEVVGAIEDVYMESVHHIFKLVAGVPNPRPAWFFDVEEQGEALTDVGTHLVDMVQWTLLPDAAIDASADVKVTGARRWPTVVSPEQFRAVTGQSIESNLDYYCNTSVSYELRGVPVKLDVLWSWEAPAGGGDRHVAIYRGRKASVEVHNSRLVVKGAHPGALSARVRELEAKYPGIGLDGEEITIPERYHVGHEAHFAQVTAQFLRYVDGSAALPAWEKPNMLAKYRVSTSGVALSHRR
jgi:predicted dehydrogenase